MTQTKRTIFVIDDEPDICEILRFNLEGAGYQVRTALSAANALQQGIAGTDLILLDIMMPGMDGFALASRLKDNPATASIPIIFLTALDSEEDTIAGFDLGADDYIPKPFSIKEVLARVAAVLRRTGDTAHHSDGPGLDRDTRSLVVDGRIITLTRIEYDILSLLMEHPEQLFSREELLQRVWPEDVIVTTRTVDVNITRIRKKLGPYANHIRTRSGFGYYYSKA
jgi:Response regulators consisting of a CheY-like receiver domain and a winged-helix DNA-binding domain